MQDVLIGPLATVRDQEFETDFAFISFWNIFLEDLQINKYH